MDKNGNIASTSKGEKSKLNKKKYYLDDEDYKDLNLTYEELLAKVKDGSHERKKNNGNLVIRTRQDKKLDAIANLVMPRVEIDKIKQIDIDVENKLRKMSAQEMRSLIYTVNNINRKMNRTRLFKKNVGTEEKLIGDLVDLSCHDRTLDSNDDIRSTYMKPT